MSLILPIDNYIFKIKDKDKKLKTYSKKNQKKIIDAYKNKIKELIIIENSMIHRINFYLGERASVLSPTTNGLGERASALLPTTNELGERASALLPTTNGKKQLLAFINPIIYWKNKLEKLKTLIETKDIIKFMNKLNITMNDINTKEFNYNHLYAFILGKIYRDDLKDYIKELNLSGIDLKYMNYISPNKLEDYFTEFIIAPDPNYTNMEWCIAFYFSYFISVIKGMSKKYNIMMEDDIMISYFKIKKRMPQVIETNDINMDLTKKISCEINKKYYIYHIYLLDENNNIINKDINKVLQNKDPNIQYITIHIKMVKLEDDIDFKKLEKDIDKFKICKSKNAEYLFYVCTIDYNDYQFYYIRLVLDYINTKINDSKNTILINDTLNHILDAKNLPNFRKVVNCYNKIKLMDRYSMIENKVGKNSFDNTNELFKLRKKALKESLKFQIQDTRAIIGTQSIYSYSYFYPEKEKSNLVTDKWWYEYFIRSLPCARGRVLQFFGTCWFNTILNIILLTPKLKDIINFPYDKSYEEYYNHDSIKDIYHFTYMVDKEIIDIINVKPPCPMCKKNKSSHVIDKTIVCDECMLQLPSHNVKNLDDILLHIKQQLISKIPNIDIPFKAFFYGKLNLNLELDDKSLLELSKIINPKNNDGGNTKFIMTLFNILKIKFNHTMIDTNCDVSLFPSYLKNSNEKIHIITSDNDFPLILVKNHNIPLKIGKYKLYAACIVANGHAVCGLLCNDIPYIYDSNNIIAYSDWPNCNFFGYYDKVMEITDEPLSFYNFLCGYDTLIYIKE
jgi:hypothetical protein